MVQGPFLEAAIFAVLIGISGFFSAAELAFLSLSTVRLHSLLEKNTPGAKTLGRLRANRRRVIISILIWNNVVNIAASALATEIAISTYGSEGLGVAIGVMSFVLLTLGEIIPKSIASTHGEGIILFISPVLEACYYLVYPLVILFELINKMIPGVYSRATGVERFTEDEVRSAVKLGAKHQGITEDERRLIENVLEFNDRTVGEAMTPKNRVVALDGNMLVATAHKKALENSMYSRFPVMVGGKVLGTISVKILGRALYQHPDMRLSSIAWQPVKIHVNEKASNAFSRLQKIGRNIAIVVDGKGEFVGVVTLEDLLEELVGEINRYPSATNV